MMTSEALRRMRLGWLYLGAVLLFLGGSLPVGLEPSGEARVAAASEVIEDGEQEGAASDAIEGTSVEAAWPMAGANPARTSWTSEEVRGTLSPIWYRVIEPYIAPYVQIIAADGLLYISTASGLYALDAETGETAWVYPTEMPLGNAPTVFDGVAYVGGYDRRLHALDAATGELKWTYEAGAGFATNPLVLEIDGRTTIYVGNRDGRLYAIEDLADQPALVWHYRTDGPVLFSAAYAGGTVYVASNDSHAYGLDAASGALIWRSEKLPGAGFQAGWPVVYQDTDSGADVVILAGSNNYRHYLRPGYGGSLMHRERNDIFPDRHTEPRGNLFGPRNSDGTIDATRVLEYFEAKPWRRTYIVLDRETGEEVRFDFDGDGQPEHAPVLWHGTHSGNRYPPVVASDGQLYQSTFYMSDPYIPGGHVTGWTFGGSSISTPSAGWIAMDEPLAYSAGGNLIYWSHCQDRSAGAFDISIPNTRFWPDWRDTSREWVYFSYNLASMIPGYSELYSGLPHRPEEPFLFQGLSASPNGVYRQHGYQNPPVPYAGRVYMHRSNAVIAFDDSVGEPIQLPMAATMPAPEGDVGTTGFELRERLAAEVSQIVDAGALRPGYRSAGLFDGRARTDLGDYLIDYWHYPSDTLYTLVLALPYLEPVLQEAVGDYLQAFYEAYPPHEHTHVGWRDGAAREAFDLPQEAEDDRVNHPPWVSGENFEGWTWPPQMFYAVWKYAEAFGSPEAVFDASRTRLETPPSNDYLIEYPYVHNAYIAGYVGYLELEALAGYPESVAVRTELERLLALRASAFEKDTPYVDVRDYYPRALSIARNFMYLVPELGEYLRETIYDEVREAIHEYEMVAPYWFVSDFEATSGEGANQHFYDYHALFQARALILQEPGIELAKHLDVPAVQVGDLFYIENIVAVLDAGLASGLRKNGTATVAEAGDTLTYTLRFSGYDGPLTVIDTLPEGLSAPDILPPEGTTIEPRYDSETHRIVWQDDLVVDAEVKLRYRVTVDTDEPAALANTAELSGPDDVRSTATFTVMANAHHWYLPLVLRDG